MTEENSELEELRREAEALLEKAIKRRRRYNDQINKVVEHRTDGSKVYGVVAGDGLDTEDSAG